MAVVKALDFRPLAKAAAEAAEDKKAENVVVLDIRKESDMADYVVIAGANSSAQMKAVRASITHVLEQKGHYPVHQEGRPTDRWMALDYGGVIIHILLPQARHFYRLESLWEKAKPVKWNSQ
jgi:ribosome-associated protein